MFLIVIFYVKPRPEESKKGNCVAEGKVQKPNVHPSEWHRYRDMCTCFPVQNWRAPNEKSRWQKQKPFQSKNVLFWQKMQLKKWNVATEFCGSCVCAWGCYEHVYVCEPPPRELSEPQIVDDWGNIWQKVSLCVSPSFLRNSFCGSLLKAGYRVRSLIWLQKDALLFFHSFVGKMRHIAGLHEEILYLFSE